MKTVKILAYICLSLTCLFVLAGIAAFFMAPELLDIYIEATERPPRIKEDALLTFYFLAPVAFFAFVALIILLINVIKGRAFNKANAVLLGFISVCALIDAVFCFVFGFRFLPVVMLGIAGIFVFLVFAIFAFFIYAAYKLEEENSLTI